MPLVQRSDARRKFRLERWDIRARKSQGLWQLGLHGKSWLVLRWPSPPLQESRGLSCQGRPERWDKNSSLLYSFIGLSLLSITKPVPRTVDYEPDILWKKRRKIYPTNWFSDAYFLQEMLLTTELEGTSPCHTRTSRTCSRHSSRREWAWAFPTIKITTAHHNGVFLFE